MSVRARRVAAGAAFAATGAAVAIGLAVPALGQDDSVSPLPVRAVPKAQSVDPRAAAALGVLRRQRTAQDQLDVVLPEIRAVGVNYALARFSRRTASGEKLYLAPATDGVCWMSASGTVGCGPVERVAQGMTFSIDICVNGLAPNMLRFWGVVPDGVDSVKAHFPSGESAPWPVVGNIYVGEVVKGDARAVPTGVSFEDPSGATRNVAYTVPPDAIIARCETGPVSK